MQQGQYLSIKEALEREGAFKISNLYGAATITAEMACMSATLWILMVVQPFSFLYWMSEVCLAISCFRCFVLLHECGHYTLFRPKWGNDVAGSFLSPLCLMPYVPWRNVHMLHHRWVGIIDKDPTQAHLLKLQDGNTAVNLVFKIVWKLWLPVPWIKFVFQVFWGYPLTQLAVSNWSNGVKSFMSVVGCASPHIALIWIVGIPRYIVLIGPTMVLYYILFENMNMPQHTGLFPYLSSEVPGPLPYREQDEITRSTLLPRSLSVLLAYNFNLHIEHHMFPSVPWYFLHSVRRLIAGNGICNYHEAKFLSFMVRLRKSDPLDIFVRSLPGRNGNSQPVELTNTRNIPAFDKKGGA
jgi:fatty acid desaturase